MSESAVSYANRQPDVEIGARVPADVAERVQELADVHHGGDRSRMAGRIIVRALDPTRAAREEAIAEGEK